MIVRRAEIHRQILRHQLVTPVLDIHEQLKQDGALDVRLGHQFLVFNKVTGFKMIDPADGEGLEKELDRHHQSMIRIPYGGQFYLHPGDFIIARTFEYITMPSSWIAYVVGRSSWGRLGVVIATATLVNVSFQGTITLEISNLGQVPVCLYPLMRIAQLVFHKYPGAASFTRKPAR